MKGEIEMNVRRRCRSCAFGHYDEDQEPCFKCFESGIRFSQWKLDYDFVMNLEN